MFSWLKWFFWTTRRCNHVAGQWIMINMGMGQMKRCVKCGKAVEFR